MIVVKMPSSSQNADRTVDCKKCAENKARAEKAAASKEQNKAKKEDKQKAKLEKVRALLNEHGVVNDSLAEKITKTV